MPARTRQTVTSTASVVEPEDEQNGLRKLRFDEPLSWRVGKSAIPVADLLSRLQALAHELSTTEQDDIDKSSLKKVSQELANGHLLAHRDKGVRAWVTSCIVDILRLCAPDAPFTGNQLKDIFTCIVTSIIPALADPSNAYNAQHIYVLNSLAEVKSIVLLTDLDNPDSLILPLFNSCFDIVEGSSKSSTGEQVAKNVEYDMTRLLVTVIDESPTLAPEVVDILITQFLRVEPRVFEQSGKKGKKVEIDPSQDTLLLKEYPPAYDMAKAICHACPEKMTSYISQYFNNVIIDASAPSHTLNGSKQSSNRRHSLDESDDETEDIKELGKAHRLIRELWRACPDVLQNVIPQLEAELSAESISLRLLATETIGDLAAGIGLSGPPPPPPMDPAQYPPVTLIGYPETVPQPNVLQKPLAPKPFAQVHSSAYESFLSRRQDKSASVRSAWTTAIGRIIRTSAGGSGLSESDEKSLVKSLANMLRDADEKVRLAGVEAIGSMGFTDIVNKLGVGGGLGSADSIFAILAERVKDRKPAVRDRAMRVFARIWAVAMGEIEDGNEQVLSLLKDAPSKIYDAFYTNDPEIQALIDRVQFEYLLPLGYPSSKSKQSKGKEAEGTMDRVRVQRILTLVKSLDEKSKKVFFAFQNRQLNLRTALNVYLQACEEYNGGVIEKDEERIKAQLGRVIDLVAKSLPDHSRVFSDLWKFAKMHDRRNYQLIRFAMAAQSDYRTVTKAIKELAKRIQSGSTPSLLDTLTPLLYRSSSLVFNRSHIPAIMEFSRTDDKGLAVPAHEILKEISSRNPEVLEAQVQEMCKDLEEQAPSAKSPDDSGSEETLKACSGFARKLPEKLPKERKFLQALNAYALYSSSPRGAKRAVSIIMAIADKKEMYAKDLVQKCVKDCEYGSKYFLTRLATLAQLNLLAPKEVDAESSKIISIAVDKILLINRSKQPDSGYTWSEELDEETKAKQWALRIIVNRLRGKDGTDEDDFQKLAEPVYSILNKLVAGEGEISKKKDTPDTQKPRLRLDAAKLLIKLSASQGPCDQLLLPKDFNSLALVVQDRLLPVRSGFINALRKRLSQKSFLGVRWYTLPCLLAFEPSVTLKDSTLTWLRSRATLFSRQMQASSKGKEHQPVMESMFARLLSLLAYHPDYPPASEDPETRMAELADFSRYILFYLSAVANENNISLIFHVAQRVKQTRDGITKSDEITERLHTLSDLAQATIRRFAEIYAQQNRIGGATGGASILQTYPGKLRLPSSLFAAMSSHKEAQEVADKSFLPEDIEDSLDIIVRSWMRPRKSTQAANASKKRKSEHADTNGDGEAKKARRKSSTAPRRASTSANTKLFRKKKTGEDEWGSDFDGDEKDLAAERRRSGRGVSKKVSYADRDSDEDDQEMEEVNEDGEEEDEANESDVGDAASANDEDEEMSDAKEQDEDQEEEEEIEEKQTTPKKKAAGKRTSSGSTKSVRTEALPVRRSSRRA
ncbi:sister chromatid cohesion and DNA repair protein (BimD), putative [Talaromyces stipitatus ATCC 10500]|uniref:Sister chromatid cohesion and DNA repair protein (BimD), putative n=1 Tax=Talaromyces stipitatus (strain ATCC 10500 / CBS 375.48 / QM 6759 / NRRL 1006) TaxID=441959 RepID=B8MPX3_TALSN|nr:sister chromatid cohesion and DNA repair protein (BimD), putative [Talaromyces stipitatus ATCC 10500]EED12863.1 sister chromatid cohesion and DNA repair protein (BimD), putative [Talaromyces stipitatus ATCC 10500]